jgi:hypothetical protein
MGIFKCYELTYIFCKCKIKMKVSMSSPWPPKYCSRMDLYSTLDGSNQTKMNFFGSHNGCLYWVSQILLHCIQIYFKNLAKVRWKIETYILIFQTQFFLYIKRINVQSKVNFTKDGTSNVTIQTTLKRLSLWTFSSNGIGN